VLVQDAAYMVTVPNIVPDTPALRKNPVFLYFYDSFTRPQPFRPDIVVDIDDVYDKRIDMLDAHVSKVYEWLRWHDGILDQVPKDPAARKRWFAEKTPEKVLPEWLPVLQKRYENAASGIKHAEAFEITEYGRQPTLGVLLNDRFKALGWLSAGLRNTLADTRFLRSFVPLPHAPYPRRSALA
jgi:hypothetical protein